MRFSWRSGITIAALALAGASASGGVQAAFSDCNANRSCIWGNNDYVWMLSERPAGQGIETFHTTDKNNQMDSWGNRTSRNSSGYDGYLGGGDCQTFGFNSRDNNVSFWNSDEVSAWRTDRGC
jgi:hypothetical protein